VSLESSPVRAAGVTEKATQVNTSPTKEDGKKKKKTGQKEVKLVVPVPQVRNVSASPPPSPPHTALMDVCSPMLTSPKVSDLLIFIVPGTK